MEPTESFFQLILRKLTSNFKGVFDLESSGALMMYSALIGIVIGLGAALFLWILNSGTEFMLGQVVGYQEPGSGTEGVGEPATIQLVWWAVLLVPTLGGLVCGWLVFTFAPEAEGHGTDAMVKSFHRLKGNIRARVPFIKALASIVTISTGGSAGREGPIAQIGAGIGSVLAARIRLTAHQKRHLMLAGAAGGIAAVFQAPLGGALFVCEVLYASTAVEFSAVVPAVIASVSAYSVFTAIYPQAHGFVAAKNLAFHGFAELPFYLVFAVVCALVGYLYVRCFYGMRDYFFKRLPIPNLLKPALGGLLLGSMVLVMRWSTVLPDGMPHVMGGGYGWIQQALSGELNFWPVLLLLCFMKIIATSLTISSGGSGGVFAPSLFIGGMLGGAYGYACQSFFGPEYIPQPEVYVLVGMGGFFAGVAKVPLTAALIVVEMSSSYELIAPLMLVSMINVAILSSRVSLYEEQVSSLIDSPAHLGDFLVDILEGISVRDVYDESRPVHFVRQEMSLPTLMPSLAASKATYFPVIDSDDHLVGIFSLSDIRVEFEGNGGSELIMAADIATFPVLTVTLDDDLHTALRRVTQKNIDEIPVVDVDDPLRVIGMLRRKDLIAAYHDQMTHLRGEI